MLSNRFSQLNRLFAILVFSYFLAGCGDGEGPTPVPGEPCPNNALVGFDSESYAANAASAALSLTDTCIGNQTVAAVIDNGTESISVDIDVDANGKGSPATILFGATDDATDTIAIKEGDVITATYQGASGVAVTDTADITAAASTSSIGVYSETFIDPVIPVSQLINVADLGGKNTVTDEVQAAVIDPLEGVNSLRAVYDATNPPAGGNYNGFVFDFSPALVNGRFEVPDAVGGNVDCSPSACDGWTAFEFVNINNTTGPSSGPVSHDAGGAQSLTMFGPFSFDSASGAYQADDTVVAGSTYTATAHVMNWAPDALAADNLGILQLTFWSAPGGQTGGGAQIGPAFEVLVDSTDDGENIYLPPQDGAEISDWTQVSITEIAPAGTASAEIFMLHIQLNNPAVGGSIFWDDVSITKGVTPPSGLGADVSSYEFLRFGLNSTAAGTLMDLEVKLVDAAAGTASVFLSKYTPTASAVAGWNLYEIPVADIPAGVDTTSIISLGLYNASSTVTGDISVTPTLFDATLYFDDVHFATGAAGVGPTLKGVLLDAPVEGVSYQSATQSGITNNLGEFEYLADEMVTFSVGGIVLGTAKGAAIITAVELTGGADPIDQTATNQLVFLQSIDEDEDPLNGITVSAATLAAAATQTLDFTLDSAAFTAAVTPVVTAITSVNPTGPNAVLSETAALNNFYVTYVAAGGTDTFAWSFPSQYPPYPGMASFPVDFEDAGGPYYIANFAGGVTTIINNPETTGNSSAKVAQMQKFTDANNFGGSKITLGTIDFTSGSVFTMKVWASRSVPVTFKLDGLNVERIATHSGSSGWEDLTFDFTGFTGEGEREIVVIFDNGVVGDAAGDATNWTFYYDDIALQASVPITYQLIWSDEFDVDGVPDTDNWTIDTGYGDNGWGNNEWQLYTTSPDNIRVEAGNLVITADCPTAPTCGVRDDSVTSGKVISQDKFSFKYGKVEARIKPPVGNGAWPAFWMLGANFPDVGWPQSGEIDVMEMHNAFSDANTTHFTMHWCDDNVSSNPCLWDPGWIYFSQELRLPYSLGDDYHVFSAEWDADGMTGKIDGTPYFYRAIDPASMDEFLKEFFMLLNVAMGGTLGSNGQPPNGSETWPQIMLVDYVRVYQDVNNSDSSFTIGGGAPLDPLGVYSETNTDPVINYSEIINVADYGGKNTVTDENSSDTVLEGAVSLKADYISTGAGLNYNGFVFNFGPATNASNLLSNGNIESTDASGGDLSGVTDWTTFETVFTNATDGPAFGPVSHDAGGTQSVKMYGPFNPNGAAGAFQSADVVAGKTYDLTAHAMSWNPDPVGLGNVGILQLSFWDAANGGGNQVGSNIEFFVDSDVGSVNTTLLPQDGADISDWTEMSVSGVAPAGAVSAKAFLLHIQSGSGGVGGSIFFDDVILGETTSPGGVGDISGYETLKFGINTSAASGLLDLEIKLEDDSSAAASVFLSAYTSTPSGVSGWDIYEIPLSDFAGIDQARVVSLGYWNASSTVTGSTAVPPTLLDGTLYFDDVHFKLGLPVGPNLLLNGDIESTDASGGDLSGVTDWTHFETVFTNSTIGPAFGPVSHDAGGTQSVKMYGPFNPNGAAGAFQSVDVVAGKTYDLTAHAMSWNPDPVGLGNVGILQLSFWDAANGGGNQVGSNIEYFVDSDVASANTTLLPQDGAEISDWTEMSVSGVAPAGAVSAKAFLLHIQSGAGGTGGSIFFDDVSLRGR